MFGSYVIDNSGIPGHHRPPGAIGQIRAMARSDAEEVSAVLSAYVLSQTEVGKVARVAQALSDLDGVQLAEDLVGPYDVIAKVQAPGLDQLGRLVVARIQVVDGVTRTLTCTVLHR
jgi:DNA-binding Lrp family transcriptional regulator